MIVNFDETNKIFAVILIKMPGKKVFVTVGTTKFDKLIEEVSKGEVLDILYSFGYSEILCQVGNGRLEQHVHEKVELIYDRYFENFNKKISEADLVISHAGAGTCLEVLKAGKALIVVINEDLMNNHQIELARELSNNGHLKYCTPDQLKEVLLENKFTECTPYPKADKNAFSTYLDKSLGFSLLK